MKGKILMTEKTFRHLASVKTINYVKSNPMAERLETAYIGGWPVVVGKDEYKQGDKIVFFEPDSLLPVENPVFAPFSDRCKHAENSYGKDCVILKTVKLRGQISQGLIVSLSKLNIPEDTEVGTDVSNVLGIEKYNPPEININSSKQPLPFPSFITKTDEERVQNLQDMVEYLCNTPNIAQYYRASEKVDGTSTTFFRHTALDDNDNVVVKYGVCSRNQQIQPNIDYTSQEWLESDPKRQQRLIMNTENTYWRNYYNSGAKNLLDQLAEQNPEATSVAIQGESIGVGINGNRLKLKDIRFLAFNVLIDGTRHNPAEYGDMFKGMIVPQLDYRLPVEYGDNPNDVMQKIINMSNNLKSMVTTNLMAEGIVWRIDDNNVDEYPTGFNPEWKHFKAINQNYLLKM